MAVLEGLLDDGDHAEAILSLVGVKGIAKKALHATSAPGLGSPLPHLPPGLGSPLPHLLGSGFAACHTCIETARTGVGIGRKGGRTGLCQVKAQRS